MDVNERLREEIDKSLDLIENGQLQGVDLKAELQKIANYQNMLIANDKANSEELLRKLDISCKERKMELEEVQSRNETIERRIKLVLDALGIIIPVGVSSYWLSKSLTFEETGCHTSRSPQWLSGITKLFRK